MEKVKKKSSKKMTLQVNENTHKRLKDIGKKGETFDEIINRLLNFYELNGD